MGARSPGCAPPSQVLFECNVLWSREPWGPGEPLSQLGHQGFTPLYVAAEQGHREIVQLLISAGPLGGGLEDLPSEARTGIALSGPPLRDRESLGKGGTP